MKRKYVILCSLVLAFCGGAIASADLFQAGGDRLVMTQHDDGGWDWPLYDGYWIFSNAPNILAPTAMGLSHAYQVTEDPTHWAALERAGAYLLNKPPQWLIPEDAYLALSLGGVLKVTTYTDYVVESFFNPLDAGTYDFLGDGQWIVDTEWYVVSLRNYRAIQKIPNLAAMDCGMGLYCAWLVGAETAPWIEGVKAEINELDSGDVYDVLGLAGAVLGLASVGEDFDPTAGAYEAAGSLADLAEMLAAHQLSTGGFTWNGSHMEEGATNETVQETAFALLAMNTFDPNEYIGAITEAAAYLESVQLPSGGWENFFEMGENNEVTGEALWAIGVAQQTLANQE
ncbi:MAG: hypothetical protein JXM73_17545 [Anaerolineae bacterium]|nr:hypothetical protein [Anaerolineae bacterium]